MIYSSHQHINDLLLFSSHQWSTPLSHQWSTPLFLTSMIYSSLHHINDLLLPSSHQWPPSLFITPMIYSSLHPINDLLLPSSHQWPTPLFFTSMIYSCLHHITDLVGALSFVLYVDQWLYFGLSVCRWCPSSWVTWEWIAWKLALTGELFVCTHAPRTVTMETSINKSFFGSKTILIKCNLSSFFYTPRRN